MDIWTQIKRSGQEAAGKAKDVAELTKLQLAQRELEAKLEKLYTQLGKRFYETAQPEEGSELFELTQGITRLKEEIAATREQQALLRGGVRCDTCGTLMEADAVFCPGCGAKRALPQEPAAEAEPGRVVCPGCGKAVGAKAFCPFCGAKLHEL